MNLIRGLILVVVFSSSGAMAERVGVEAGTYFSESGEPQQGNDSPLVCPGRLTVNGTSVTIPVSAQFGTEHHLDYGSLTVALGAQGAFHDDLPLAKHKPFKALPDEEDEEFHTYYRTLERLHVDVDTIEVGGGGVALMVRLQTLPKPGIEEGAKGYVPPSECNRTLLKDVPLKSKPGKKDQLQGSYWIKSSSGRGSTIRCPSWVSVSGGKITMARLDKYLSWTVRDLPIKKNAFQTEVSVAKLPPADVLRAAGYYEDDIRSIGDGMTLTLEGKFQGVRDVASGNTGQTVTIHIESDNQECEAEYFHQGFNTTTRWIDCSRLSASERKKHPVCH